MSPGRRPSPYTTGRLHIRLFRGLHGVHRRCGLPARRPPEAARCSTAFDGFLPLRRSIATEGATSYPAGFASAEIRAFPRRTAIGTPTSGASPRLPALHCDTVNQGRPRIVRAQPLPSGSVFFEPRMDSAPSPTAQHRSTWLGHCEAGNGLSLHSGAHTPGLRGQARPEVVEGVPQPGATSDWAVSSGLAPTECSL